MTLITYIKLIEIDEFAPNMRNYHIFFSWKRFSFTFDNPKKFIENSKTKKIFIKPKVFESRWCNPRGEESRVNYFLEKEIVQEILSRVYSRQ